MWSVIILGLIACLAFAATRPLAAAEITSEIWAAQSPEYRLQRRVYEAVTGLEPPASTLIQGVTEVLSGVG